MKNRKIGTEPGNVKAAHVKPDKPVKFGYKIKETWLVDGNRVNLEATGKTFDEAFKQLRRPNGASGSSEIRLLMQDRERVSYDDLPD